MGESEFMVDRSAFRINKRHSTRELSPNPHTVSMEVLQVLVGVHEVHVPPQLGTLQL